MGSEMLTYAFLALATYSLARWFFPPKHTLPHIPAVTPTFPILSFWGSFKSLRHNRDIILDGYHKYKGGAFKIPELFNWHVVVTGPKLIEELRKAPDEKLSFNDAVIEQLSMDSTFGPSIMRNPYHIPLIRSQLTRSLVVLFADVREELTLAFDTYIPPTDDWTPVPVLQTLMKIVSRTSNRIFVGAPTCRNEDYVDLNITFTVDAATTGIFLNFFPKFLRPIIGHCLTSVPKSIDRGVKHLGPVIAERYRKMEEEGLDYEGKPNDFLSWLMDVAEGEEKGTRELVLRILSTNFGAIHTSSNSFGHALFRLAANPEWILPMREEVERVVKEEGWTKNALQKMYKCDSFLKESQRFDGLGSLVMTRLAIDDFTFSDGTYIPKGTFVSAAMLPTHRDTEYYPDPEVFNPWRFSELRTQSGEELKHQLVSTTSEYVTFGHGKHACPGRFFAANELKGMLAHLVTTYDVKLEKEAEMPQPSWLASTMLPNRVGRVLFRKRRD